MDKRSCGILLHISSLPAEHGIGTLGRDAYRFVDFLKKAGQSYWQILPVGPTGYGDSPYQSYSAYAGNPLFIDLDMLIDEGLLSIDDHDLLILDRKNDFADYAQLFSFKNIILQKAYGKFNDIADDEKKRKFEKFCRKNAFWLDDYALFMALKYHFRQKMWTEWDDDIRLRRPEAVASYSEKLADVINYWKFVQFVFFGQYKALKKYANKKGIKIYGDMPIYVSMDSADIWAQPEMFMLDEDNRPVKVAGCPPDAFAPTGQLWGNPLYDWEAMEKDGYKWWISRVKYSAKLFDLTRIDHFRGFESFYAIPAEDDTAEHGTWLNGPSMKLFRAIKAELGDVELVAEDLGFLTDDVRKMLKESGYPGMNVLEFAFGEDKADSSYLPHNYNKNSVVYIGTHDNQTAKGWYDSASPKVRKFVDKYTHRSEYETAAEALIRTAYSSVSQLAVIQMQDILELGDEARMNVPSTIGNGNWAWRMDKEACTKKLAKKLKKLAKLYYRYEKPEKAAEDDKKSEESSKTVVKIKLREKKTDTE